MHMRADGTSFLLKFPAGAGLTYKILAVLKAGSAAAHLRLAIFPPEAIGSASTSAGSASESACELPPSAQGLQSKDATEMTFGTWGSPAHGQTWGEQHRCADLTRVGPPESDGCDGEYRYFAGQSFSTNHTWDWTAPFTADYVLQLTANCDVPYYDDPTQPGCTITADGIECDDDRVTQCAAAIGLTIQVVDRSVHVKHTFDVPVTQEVLDNIELQQQMADMFGLQQQPAVVFPLSISPLDCDLPANQEKSVCHSVTVGGRRRIQVQRSADVDHVCPQFSFNARASAMRATCGLSSSDAADPLLQGQCPSLECAAELPSLLEDCAEVITEFTRQIGAEAQFYGALNSSELASNCETMNQTAPAAASVQVEFRAPNRAVAEQLIQEHQRMVHKTFQHLSGRVDESNGGHRILDESVDARRVQSVDERPLCFGNADASAGDGTRCGGRRQLDSDEKDEEIRRLKAELEKSRAETEAAVRRSTEKDQVIERFRVEIQTKDQIIKQQKKSIEKQSNEIAFHRRLHRLRQNEATRQNVSNGKPRNQTVAGRRTQAFGSSGSSVLRSARVGADRSVKAFFTVTSGSCTASEDGRCVGRPDGYSPNEQCEIIVAGDENGVLGPCPKWNIPWGGVFGPDELHMPDGIGHHTVGGAVSSPSPQDFATNFDGVLTDNCPVGMVLYPGQALQWQSNNRAQGRWQICFRTPSGQLPCCTSLCANTRSGHCAQLGGQCSPSGPRGYQKCGHSTNEYCRCGCYYDAHYNIAYCDESLSGWEDSCDRRC
eukprot:SAG11_NODE_2642_length_3138_cov_2.834814_2_plen_774_part_00